MFRSCFGLTRKQTWPFLVSGSAEGGLQQFERQPDVGREIRLYLPGLPAHPPRERPRAPRPWCEWRG